MGHGPAPGAVLGGTLLEGRDAEDVELHAPGELAELVVHLGRGAEVVTSSYVPRTVEIAEIPVSSNHAQRGPPGGAGGPPGPRDQFVRTSYGRNCWVEIARIPIF